MSNFFRDFLTENEIKTYIERASPHLFRSTHGTNKLGREQSSSTSSHLRTSKQFWVKEDLDFLPYSQDDEVIVPLATKVSHRIQNATLMNVFNLNGGEAFQVANYGIAGQYSQHYDAASGFYEFEFLRISIFNLAKFAESKKMKICVHKIFISSGKHVTNFRVLACQ